MRLEEFKKRQKKSLEDFEKKVSGANVAAARREATIRLRKAGIIDGDNRLTSFYR